MADNVDRRKFLTSLGVTVGALTLDVPLGELAMAVRPAGAQEPPRGRVPDTPVTSKNVPSPLLCKSTHSPQPVNNRSGKPSLS